MINYVFFVSCSYILLVLKITIESIDFMYVFHMYHTNLIIIKKKN
jgi:hypothetical protein